MRKIFKAAAALGVGCALLSTSAFAALMGEPVLNAAKDGIDVTVSELGARNESTILVLKGALDAMPGSINPDDIVYINQKTATDEGKATYSMPLGTRVGDAEAVTVFAGGTAETSATKLGVIELATSPTLPEGTVIAIRNADPYGMTGYSVVTVSGIDSGSVKIKDADGNEVAAYLADYSAFSESGGVKKYVALVKGASFTLENIVYDPDGTAEAVVFGDVAEPTGELDALDTAHELKIVAKVVENSTLKSFLASDLNADGVVDALDVADSLKLVAKVILITDAAK